MNALSTSAYQEHSDQRATDNLAYAHSLSRKVAQPNGWLRKPGQGESPKPATFPLLRLPKDVRDVVYKCVLDRTYGPEIDNENCSWWLNCEDSLSIEVYRHQGTMYELFRLEESESRM